MKTWFHGNELAKRLKTIPGIGCITACALAASVSDPHRFTSSRQFAASLGLTPRADSSGGGEADGTHLQDGGPVSSTAAGAG